jgi:DNA repair protein RadC
MRISEGSLTASIVHPREVFSAVVRESAAGVIFLHNHPSGDPTPSREDINITRRLKDGGDLLGIRVLDHIIIGHDSFASLADSGHC